MICHVAVTVAACVCTIVLYIAEVVAVCAALCARFDRFNAFHLLFQIEKSEGTSATTVIRGSNHGDYWWKSHLLWMEIVIIS